MVFLIHHVVERQTIAVKFSSLTVNQKYYLYVYSGTERETNGRGWDDEWWRMHSASALTFSLLLLAF